LIALALLVGLSLGAREIIRFKSRARGKSQPGRPADGSSYSDESLFDTGYRRIEAGSSEEGYEAVRESLRRRRNSATGAERERLNKELRKLERAHGVPSKRDRELAQQAERAAEWKRLQAGPFSVELRGLTQAAHPFQVEFFLSDVQDITSSQARNLVERAAHIGPQTIAENISQRDAVRLKVALEKRGAKVKIIEQATGGARKAIPTGVRREVWNRDGGKCVDCGSRENLEYDHVIPLSKGGSNTARNITLRCEACNRKKAASI
jgi:hypothetical protein